MGIEENLARSKEQRKIEMSHCAHCKEEFSESIKDSNIPAGIIGTYSVGTLCIKCAKIRY